ncbi:MAG: rhodanese-like domain-containing protein [Methanothrix sp.]|nr:rhodanese-like domain-containing protein [Methanothrix sp.]
MLLIAAMVPGADAGCSCAGGCSVGNWELSASTFLNSDVPGYDNADNNTAAVVESGNEQSVYKPKDRSDLFTSGQILKSLGALAGSDVVIHASQGDGYSQSHIKGAIHIPSSSLIDDNGDLKPIEELAEILGEAGVSREDSIVVYSEDLSSGDATFFLWALKYLGQDDVKVLDGSLEDWNAANLPVESSSHKRPAVSYNPNPRSDLLASYDSVNNSSVQIVDARPFAEFGKGRIPGATSLDPAVVLQDGKIKDESRLSGIFSRLSKDEQVMVYSSDYNQASLVWYALQLLGYSAEMYTWSDWTAHQPASENGKDAGRYKELG